MKHSLALTRTGHTTGTLSRQHKNKRKSFAVVYIAASDPLILRMRMAHIELSLSGGNESARLIEGVY